MEQSQLIQELQASRKDFLDAIEGLDEEEFRLEGVVGEWSIKDLLAHVSRWEGETVTMLWQVRNGQVPDRQEISGEEMVDELNARWHEESSERPLDIIRADFEALRPQTIRRVSEFTDEELNDPDLYEWLRDSPLWRWIAVDTYEHEREHAQQIREWRKQKEKPSHT